MPVLMPSMSYAGLGGNQVQIVNAQSDVSETNSSSELAEILTEYITTTIMQKKQTTAEKT